MRARIIEQGNGLPTAGDYVGAVDQLYRIVSITSRIQTNNPSGNWVYAEVEEVDWADCSEEDEFAARLQLVEDDE